MYQIENASNEVSKVMSNSDDSRTNPLLNKLKRPPIKHLPTGHANAFFGENQKSKILNFDNSILEYIDTDGIKKNIHLTHCKNKFTEMPDYIGNRGFLSSPPWIEFFDSNCTRFEFESKKEAQWFLSEILTKLNLKTIDTD